MGRAEFGSRYASGRGQAAKCSIASLRTFEDLARDVATNPVFLSPD